MSATIPYVVTVVFTEVREVIVSAVTSAEAREEAEKLPGVSRALDAVPQDGGN